MSTPSSEFRVGTRLDLVTPPRPCSMRTHAHFHKRHSVCTSSCPSRIRACARSLPFFPTSLLLSLYLPLSIFPSLPRSLSTPSLRPSLPVCDLSSAPNTHPQLTAVTLLKYAIVKLHRDGALRSRTVLVPAVTQARALSHADSHVHLLTRPPLLTRLFSVSQKLALSLKSSQ